MKNIIHHSKVGKIKSALALTLTALALLFGPRPAAAHTNTAPFVTDYQGILTGTNGVTLPDSDFECVVIVIHWECSCPFPVNPYPYPCSTPPCPTWDGVDPTNYVVSAYQTNTIHTHSGLFNMLLSMDADFLATNAGAVYLQMYVGTNDQSLVALSPAQLVTPTPLAAVASTLSGPLPASSLSGTLASAQLQGVYGSVLIMTNTNNVLAGDGSQLANVNATTVGGQTASSILSGISEAKAATSANVPGAIVERDTNGNFSANALTLSGALNLPFPAVLSSGGENFMIEEGSLYMGFNNSTLAVNLAPLYNTGFGDYALHYDATTPSASGAYNTAVGEYALYANTSGGYNTAVGLDALQANNVGFNNTAVGWSALQANTNGHANTAVGFRALYFNTDGADNVAMGYDALEINISGSGNTAIGVSALAGNTTNELNTAVGEGALTENGGNKNTGIGYDAMAFTTNESDLVAVGYEALLNDNAGGTTNTASQTGENTAVGYQALWQNTTGFDNTAVGYLALQGNQLTAFNTAVGALALFNNINGAYNTATGFEALYANTNGYWNVADGYQSLYNNTTGYSNTANGVSALFANTTGAYNTGTGAGTLSANTTGWFNTASGYNALYENTSGFYNTAEGAFALHSSTGSYNIALGVGAGANLVTGSSNIYIGNPGLNGDNHAIRIGDVTDTNTTVTVIAGIFNGTLGSAGTEVLVDASGHLGVRVSSAKFKHDIQPMGDVSDVLLKLKPVTFKYNADRDPSGTPEFGLVAEQVNEVDPDLVVRDGNHQIYSVRYEAVNAMLLNEFLKQHQTVEEQSATIADLKARLDRMEQMISKHE